jgi:hypothetical protein
MSIFLKNLLTIQSLLVLSPNGKKRMIRIEIPKIETLDRIEVFLCRV